VKINIDCGQEYLEGWLNVDGLGDKTPTDRLVNGSKCDTHKIPLDGQAEWIRVKRVYERLREEKVEGFLADVEQALQPGGIFVLIVAKHDDTQFELGSRGLNPHLVFGPHDYTRHMFRFSADQLIGKILEYGFEFVGEILEFHEYPCFVLKFKKLAVLAPRDYIKLPEIPVGSQVLDIGPGRYPLPIATHYLDHTDKNYNHMSKETYIGERIIGSIEEKTGFADKQFDFVYASHVFEHLQDPIAAAKEVSRIGKAGIMICPGVYKEFLFGYEEDEHLWDIFPEGYFSRAAVFIRRDLKAQEKFKEPDFQSIQAGLFRIGRFDWRERRYLRAWYRRMESSLDVVVYWKDDLIVNVL